MDEVGLYDPDRQSKIPASPADRSRRLHLQLLHIDRIYDGLRENHVRPFIELWLHAAQAGRRPGGAAPSGTSPTSHRPRTIKPGIR